MINYPKIIQLCIKENHKLFSKYKGELKREDVREVLKLAYLGLTCEMFEALTVLVNEDREQYNLENKLDCIEEVYDCIQNAVHCLTIGGISLLEITKLKEDYRKQYRVKSISSMPLTTFPIVGESITKYVLTGTFLESKSAPKTVVMDIIKLIISAENYLELAHNEYKYQIDIRTIMDRKLTKWESKIDTF